MTQSRLPSSLGRVSLRSAALALLLVGLAVLPAQAAAGDLDTTFGSGGTIITIMPNKGWGNQIAIQPDGKLVVGGFNGANTVTDVSVVRYNTDGTLDTTFGPSHTGIVITNFGGQDYARATILQPDGKILAGGSGGAANGGDFALARYNSDGTLDSTFGAGGMVLTDFAGRQDVIRALLLLPADNKIIAAGFTTPTVAWTPPSAWRARSSRTSGASTRAAGPSSSPTARS